MSISICSLNVRGLRDSLKRRKLFLWLRKKKFNIYFLQETHSTKNDEYLWKNEWGAKAYFTYSYSNATGCGILFDCKLDITVNNIIRDDTGRYLILEVNINDSIYTFVNLYCHNKDNPQFFQNVFNILLQINIDNLIVGGDMNFVQDPTIDKQGRISNTFKHSRDILNKFLEEKQLIDIWRIRHPFEKKFTWFKRNPDFFLDWIIFLFL